MACRRYAASLRGVLGQHYHSWTGGLTALYLTVLAMGPIVSCRSLMGITSAREVSPTVGLIPTKLFTSLGLKMLPLVSDPSVARARPSEDATPLPLDDPLGSCCG